MCPYEASVMMAVRRVLALVCPTRKHRREKAKRIYLAHFRSCYHRHPANVN